MKKLLSSVNFLVVVLLVKGIKVCQCENSTIRCIEGERQALLKLKQSFDDPSNQLISWNGKDCCQWRGIGCDQSSGHVVKLDLRSLAFEQWYVVRYHLSASEVDSCLAELKHLEYLDLSGNDFKQSRIPKFFGSFKHLRYLNLSNAGLGGKIPLQLGNLTRLRVLDLSASRFSSPQILFEEKLQWVSSLSALQHLEMNGIDLGETLNLMEVLNTLPSLILLSLRGCGIKNIQFSRSFNRNSSFFSSVQFLDISKNMLGREIPYSLQNMTALRELDLSENDFNTSVPLWLVNSKSLVHLDLSLNRFDNVEGGLLSLLNNACSLKWLDLSDNFHLRNDLFMRNRKNSSKCLSYALEFLDLSDAISGGSIIPNWLGQLKALKFLDLSRNHLEGPIPSSLGDCSALKELYLSFNNLSHSIPESLGRLPLLQHLDISNNKLEGTIPKSLGRLALLRELNLEWNQLNGTILEHLGRLSNLEVLILSWNHLEGTIPPFIGNLSFLKKLDLSQNQITGTIPESLGRLIHLEELSLSNNTLNGTIPYSIGKLSSLTSLYLSQNKLSGSIPVSFGNLENLTRLDISYNFLVGVVSELHFSNLSHLVDLNIGSNHLSFKVKSNWNPPFHLSALDMSHCFIGSQYPKWLQNQTELVVINLSNTNLTGSFPTWLIPSGGFFVYLDLSNNQISGNLPWEISNVQYLHLSGNLLNGPILNSMCGLNLVLLDLSRNSLSGEIPECFGSLQVLYVLILSSNKLSGPIPSSIGKIPNLTQLRLNANNLEGELPFSLRNSTNLEVLDLGENRFTGPIPTWTGESFRVFKVLRLRNNKFSGGIPLQLCKLSQLQILDLSRNNLSGVIPHCFNNFTQMTLRRAGLADRGYLVSNYFEYELNQVEITQVVKGMELNYLQKQLRFLNIMDLSANKLVGTIPEELCLLAGLRSLNLSRNHLSGKIPDKIGGLESIESLDLSNNKLFGKIPQKLAVLMSLNHLNLSNNNFSGEIPTGNQLQTLNDPSIYAGNLQLCGDPLPRKCPNEDGPARFPINYDEDDEEDKVLFWLIVVAGYATGFSVVLGTLIVNKNWRIGYFRFVENTKERITVMYVTKVERLKKKRSEAKE